MQYLGGKHKQAKWITAILEAHRAPGQRFVDVFCGGLSITAAMGDHGPRVANDGCAPLIRLYEAWREGWRPPAEVSEELWCELKAKQDPNDPLTAFAGFGCSYGGKWFGGYARDNPAQGHYFRDAAMRGLDRKFKTCGNVEFMCADFSALLVDDGDFVYCDAPYQCVEVYRYFRAQHRPFNRPLYLEKLVEWSRAASHVFVSEYEAQSPHWELVAERQNSREKTFGSGRMERLFRIHPEPL